MAFTKLTIDLSTIRTYHPSIKSVVTSVNVEFPESLKGDKFIVIKDRDISIQNGRGISNYYLGDNHQDREIFILPITSSNNESIIVDGQTIDKSQLKYKIKESFKNLAESKFRESAGDSTAMIDENTLLFRPSHYFEENGESIKAIANFNDNIVGKIKGKRDEILTKFENNQLDYTEALFDMSGAPNVITNYIKDSANFTEFNNNNPSIYTLTKGNDEKGHYLVGKYGDKPYIST